MTGLVMNDFYESHFGIHNHLQRDPNRPMASVGMFQNEANGYNSRLYALFKKYHEARILKYFGLNLLEFINNPREQIEWMFKLAEEFIKQDLKTDEDAAKALKEGLIPK
jgi:hypothetical protein